MTSYQELASGTVTQSLETICVGRLDAAVKGVPLNGLPCKVTGIMGKCANAGYVVLRVAGTVVGTLDMAALTALVDWAVLDIDVPAGQQLSVYWFNSAGTTTATMTIRYQQ